jgi:predicted secreted protein
MNQSTILALAIVFSSVLIVSGSNFCDNAPCESQINANLGKDFTISLESNPSTGFEWWTNFDPNYLSLSNSTFIGGKKLFTFNTRSTGNTEVIMLLLRPWENGTIAERKIFPINIISTGATLKQATVQNKIANLVPIKERKIIPINVNSATTAPKQAIMVGKSIGGMTTNPISNGQTTMTTGTSSNSLKNDSAMETPYQAISSHGEPGRYELSSLSQRSK